MKINFTKKQFTYHQLFDATMDINVYLMLCELGIITGKAKKELLKSMPELEDLLKHKKNQHAVNIYNEALNNEKLERSLLNNLPLYEMDDHIYWTKPKKGKENQMGGGGTDIWSKLYSEVSNQLAGFGPLQGIGSGQFSQMFLAEDMKESEISYEEYLRRFASFEEIIKIDDETFDLMWYTTGLEMYDDMPIIEFNETKEDYVINEFVLAIDTSGSCSGDIMEDFLSQTIKIFKDMEIGNRRVRMKLIQCDYKITHEQDITCQTDIDEYISNFNTYGFGGTDFNPVFDRVKQLQDEGQLTHLKGLIYLSDGFGSFPAEKPEYETVFVLPPEEYQCNYIPSWVTTLKL